MSAGVQSHERAIPSLLQICRRAVVQGRRLLVMLATAAFERLSTLNARIPQVDSWNIGHVPLPALDNALSAMSEEELRMLEFKTERDCRIDLIADTWPLWYSIYVRKYGYKAAQEETKITSKRQLNAKTILVFTELNKHRPHRGKAFTVPLVRIGRAKQKRSRTTWDWRQAVDFRVTDEQIKFLRAKETLRKARQEAQAAEEAAKVKAATPQRALLPPKAVAAQWKRQNVLKKGSGVLKIQTQLMKKMR